MKSKGNSFHWLYSHKKKKKYSGNDLSFCWIRMNNQLVTFVSDTWKCSEIVYNPLHQPHAKEKWSIFWIINIRPFSFCNTFNVHLKFITIVTSKGIYAYKSSLKYAWLLSLYVRQKASVFADTISLLLVSMGLIRINEHGLHLHHVVMMYIN